MRARRSSWTTALVALATLLTGACASSQPPGPDQRGADGPGASVASGAPGGTAATGTLPPSTRGTGVARPTVSGPITGGGGVAFGAMPKALAAEYGYVEEEFFVSGEATTFVEDGPWGTDGVWRAKAGTKAPFTTRVLVRRPADLARFDGTALVEWFNVSSGQDVDVVFGHARRELLAHGTVYVGVSAQAEGIDGRGGSMPMPGLVATPLKTFDPARYAPLVHPGDDHSYDILSQVAAALLRPQGADLLGGGRVAKLIAAGESQSAARMVTYVNAVHPVAQIFDGFLVHSRSNGGSVLRSDPVTQPPFAHIRADLDAPVLQFQTESDILGLNFIVARQPDTDRLRTWEVAGTAHLDQGMLDYRFEVAGLTERPAVDPMAAACGTINTGPMGQVLSKAMSSLRAWVVDGTAPAAGSPIEVRDDAIVRDAFGNAMGGIRTPPVDAPTVTLRGDGAADAGYVCMLFGRTLPIDPAALASRYPNHEAYVDAVTRSARAAVDAGHLLPRDADAFVEQARRSTIGT